MRILSPRESRREYLNLVLLLIIVLTLSGCNRTKNPVVVNAPLPTETTINISQSPTDTPVPITSIPSPSLSALDSTSTSSEEVIATPTEVPATTVHLLAVGDNLIHIQVVESGKQADGTYDYDHLYSNVKDEISSADIAVINQETIFGGDKFPYSGYPNFNSPDGIGNAVVNAGFDVVLQATNHAMDMGVDGIEHTLNFWRQFPQITVLGINKSEASSQEIRIIKKNGIKIAMLNYTYGLNGYSLPKDKPYLVNLLDKDRMKKDIAKAKELADFTIVFPHWGTEYMYEASDVQKELTEFFYQQGVDLVIGSHPHVLEPVEWIETEAGHRMLVYYSLGNFMSYQKEAPRMLGGMANVTITKDGTGTYISDASITPIITHFENGPADYNYAIYRLSDYNEALASVHGVSDIAKDGKLTYQGTIDLAKRILGTWYQQQLEQYQIEKNRFHPYILVPIQS